MHRATLSNNYYQSSTLRLLRNRPRTALLADRPRPPTTIEGCFFVPVAGSMSASVPGDRSKMGLSEGEADGTAMVLLFFLLKIDYKMLWSAFTFFES